MEVFLQQDDERLRLEAQREGLELQGLQTHEVPWAQERATLQQEVRLYRRNIIIIYMKLRWILMHWRLGRKEDSGDDAVHPEVSPTGVLWTYFLLKLLSMKWFSSFFERFDSSLHQKPDTSDDEAKK